MMTKLVFSLLLVLLVVFPTAACAAPGGGPATPGGNGTIDVNVTDALPREVTAVVIKAGNIQVHRADDAEDKWITILTNPPAFDLVKVAGITAPLGASDIPAGRYTQVRLDITEVTVTIDGREVKATVPSEKLRLVGNVMIEAGKTTSVTIDFDAEKSVILAGNQVLLKPVVKLLVGEPGKGKPGLESAPAAGSPPAAPSRPEMKGKPSGASPVSLAVTAKAMAFDQKSLTVPAGAAVTITFNNQDGMAHNIAIYEDSSARKPIFIGEMAGAGKTLTYTFAAPEKAGTYFFRCDPHPFMSGSFIVQ